MVYQLVAPGGDVYVMQAYSQIRDRTLTLKDLPKLGKRLDLPPGWRYRVRRLKAPLAVAPQHGDATIVQDELQNTYQLCEGHPAGRQAQAPRAEHRRQVDGTCPPPRARSRTSARSPGASARAGCP